MNIKMLPGSKKYLSRIFMCITFFVLIIVILLSVINYNASKRILQQNEYESSSKLLTQVKLSIDQMDATIKNLCSNLYINPDVISMINNTDENIDIVDFTTKINKLTLSITTTNPFVHSVCIYNGIKDEYYYAGKRSLLFEDTTLNDIMKKYPGLPKLRPIWRKINSGSNPNDNEYVFTYIIYETSSISEKISGAVIVNVMSEWLIDNINTVNMTEKDGTDKIFILDSNNNFIENKKSNDVFKKALKDEYLKYKKSPKPGKQKIFFECRLNGMNYIVTFINTQNEDLTLLKIQPSRIVYKNLDILKNMIAVITGIFLLMALLFSIALSGIIYKPFGNLVNSVAGFNRHQSDKPEFKDEISYLNNVYKFSIEKLNQYDNEKCSNMNIIRAYWMKKLLTESFTLTEDQFFKAFEENSIKIRPCNKYVVCVLKIDNFYEFKQKHNKEREFIISNLINKLLEIVSEYYYVEGVEMNEDQIALIVSISTSTGEDFEDLEKLIRKGQESIKLRDEISLSASISNMGNSISDITECYENASKNSIYRFSFGKMCMIRSDTLNQRISMNTHDSLRKCEAKLIESVKALDMCGFETALHEIFNILPNEHYNNIVIDLIRLVDIIKKSLDSMGKLKCKSNLFDFSRVSQKIFELETLEELHQFLKITMAEVLSENPIEQSTSGNNIIVETVINMIKNNYTHNSLCINEIASMLKFNPRRLSRIFKNATGIPIFEYINEIRLEKAVELLANSELTVYEINEKIGIENESYFYSLFKKKYGTTPKEYIQMQRINNFT